MRIQTLSPVNKIPLETILSNQTHGTNIVEIITGKEDLSNCDGMWTRDLKFKLGIRTADCAPICFWDGERFGILHVGWRGLVGGICEKMLKLFEPNVGTLHCNVQKNIHAQPIHTGLNIFVGPILPRFEIQRDFCYEAIEGRFGKRFFNVDTQNLSVRPSSDSIQEYGVDISLQKKKQNRILFNFEVAIRSVLPMAEFDGRNTFMDSELASWRRDGDERRNVTVIGVD